MDMKKFIQIMLFSLAAAVVVELLSAVTLPGAVAIALVLRRRTGSDL